MAATKSKSTRKSSTRRSSPRKSSSRKRTKAATRGPRAVDIRKIHIDDNNRRNDLDAVPGRAAIIKKGEHSGTTGVIDEFVSWNDDGYPKEVNFRPRNTANVILSVKYDDIDALLAGFGGL